MDELKAYLESIGSELPSWDWKALEDDIGDILPDKTELAQYIDDGAIDPDNIGSLQEILGEDLLKKISILYGDTDAAKEMIGDGDVSKIANEAAKGMYDEFKNSPAKLAAIAVFMAYAAGNEVKTEDGSEAALESEEDPAADANRATENMASIDKSIGLASTSAEALKNAQQHSAQATQSSPLATDEDKSNAVNIAAEKTQQIQQSADAKIAELNEKKKAIETNLAAKQAEPV